MNIREYLMIYSKWTLYPITNWFVRMTNESNIYNGSLHNTSLTSIFGQYFQKISPLFSIDLLNFKKWPLVSQTVDYVSPIPQIH